MAIFELPKRWLAELRSSVSIGMLRRSQIVTPPLSAAPIEDASKVAALLAIGQMLTWVPPGPVKR